MYIVDVISGVEGTWLEATDPLSDGVVKLLHMAGSDYLPFLLANEAASKTGKSRFTVRLRGLEYAQGTLNTQSSAWHF